MYRRRETQIVKCHKAGKTRSERGSQSVGEIRDTDWYAKVSIQAGDMGYKNRRSGSHQTRRNQQQPEIGSGDGG